MNDLKKNVLSGVFWKFSERMAAQLVSLVVTVILARLLAPEDYGIISLVTVFITIANVFVTSGFGTALIQKKDADEIDFSTVFYFNVLFSILIYVILFFAAGWVSDFYQLPELIPVLRVLSISIPVAAVNSIQQAYVSREMIFKKFFFSTLFGTVVSAIVGIAMAYLGFGVWALVAQSLTNTIVDTLVLWFTVRWRPKKVFSFERLKALVNYGWKLLVQGLILNIYSSMRSLVIGKVYTAADLAYYTKGCQYPQLIVGNVDTALSSALFPAMSKEQDDANRVKSIARRTTSVCSYVMNPMLIGLAVVAPFFVSVLLTDKWLPAVPYLRIICIVLLFRAPQTAMLQAIKAIGRSDVILKVDFFIRIFAITVLFISVKYGVLYVALSEVATTIIGTILYFMSCGREINYKLKELVVDFIPNTIISALMGIVVWLVGEVLTIAPLIVLIIQIAVGAVVYVLLSVISKNESFRYIVSELKQILKKRG